MPTYAVRLAETKEAVGVFAASGLDALMDYIDAYSCSPNECEAAVMRGAAVVFDADAPSWDEEGCRGIAVAEAHEDERFPLRWKALGRPDQVWIAGTGWQSLDASKAANDGGLRVP